MIFLHVPDFTPGVRNRSSSLLLSLNEHFVTPALMKIEKYFSKVDRKTGKNEQIHSLHDPLQVGPCRALVTHPPV